jgi:hypothetical protein
MSKPYRRNLMMRNTCQKIPALHTLLLPRMYRILAPDSIAQRVVRRIQGADRSSEFEDEEGYRTENGPAIPKGMRTR